MKPCILPWINFSTTTFGRPRVCGYSDDATLKKVDVNLKNSSINKEWNNEYFKEIRRDFINGKWPENCKRCKYVEDLGGISKRIVENEARYDEYNYLISNTAPDGIVSHKPIHIDIRTGTVCNLKCIHCGTGASSKWKEDKLLLDKYPNTTIMNIDNSWIEKDRESWNSLKSGWGQVKRYNFLGGESFANKRHNEFLKELSETEYAKDIVLSYVSNGLLITKDKLNQLSKFKFVSLRISVDAPTSAGEYFRFPLKWNDFKTKLKIIEQYAIQSEVFDVGVQWTSSNVSIFYLTEMYDIIKNEFPTLKFLFCNHVEYPIHMSTQNLPMQLKLKIVDKIKNYNFNLENQNEYTFYLNHMLEKDLWPEYGKVFMQYLDDLDQARNTNWKYSLKEMNLNTEDLRK
jgi:MoaA/NifB/PqqE/SkfB family radical SAM enzyme